MTSIQCGKYCNKGVVTWHLTRLRSSGKASWDRRQWMWFSKGEEGLVKQTTEESVPGEITETRNMKVSAGNYRV